MKNARFFLDNFYMDLKPIYGFFSLNIQIILLEKN